MKSIRLFGDSILKGVIVNPLSQSYKVDNNMGLENLQNEFGISILNSSRFGMTVTKGFEQIKRDLMACDQAPDVVFMDYGGNDADFFWPEIAQDPFKDHQSKTEPGLFMDTYNSILDYLLQKGIRPILFNLPPIDAQSYFNWFTNHSLSSSQILAFLDNDIGRIYRYQERYSHMVEDLARKRGCLLVDIRGEFLKNMSLRNLLCMDGIHPSYEGQKIIGQALRSVLKTNLLQAC